MLTGSYSDNKSSADNKKSVFRIVDVNKKGGGVDLCVFCAIVLMFYGGGVKNICKIEDVGCLMFL